MPQNESAENSLNFPCDFLEEPQKSQQDDELVPQKRPGAILLAVDFGKFDAEDSLQELAALADAAEIDVLAEVLQKKDKAEPATIMGKGRLAEAKLLAHNLLAQLAIFDGELSGSQLRNLEQWLGIPVIDRTMLILEIFASRATSREGKIQTELAILEYRLPRLAGHGVSLSRQGGGGGGGAGARRGGGETKLEYDRRYIKERITVLKRRLEEVKARRGETRRARSKSGVPLVALVGYTNVGKSSLVNAICGSDIGVKDMLFASLDPTARRLVLPNGQAAVMVDTVGFVSRLPHNLVEAFKSTLEEAKYANLLLLVCDAASPESAKQLQISQEVLQELGTDEKTPRIVVYNKSDLVPNFVPFDESAAPVSATTGQGLESLVCKIEKALWQGMCHVQVLLPYNKLALADILRKNGTVLVEDFLEDGVLYKASLEKDKAHFFAEYMV